MKELLAKLKDLDPDTWRDIAQIERLCNPPMVGGVRGAEQLGSDSNTKNRNRIITGAIQGVIQDAIEAIEGWAWHLDYCSWGPYGHKYGATVWYGVDDMEMAEQCPTAAEALLTAYMTALEETT